MKQGQDKTPHYSVWTAQRILFFYLGGGGHLGATVGINLAHKYKIIVIMVSPLDLWRAVPPTPLYPALITIGDRKCLLK